MNWPAMSSRWARMSRSSPIGQRVVAANSAPCDECFFCRRGLQNLCEDLLFNNGAYAEYIRIPARIVERNTYRHSAACGLSGRGAGGAAGLRGARLGRDRSAARRHHRDHRAGPHRVDVREAGQAVRLPRDRDRPAADATGPRGRAGRRRTDRGATTSTEPGGSRARSDRRPRRGYRHRGRGQAADLAVGGQHGAARRHGQLLRRLPQRQHGAVSIPPCCTTPKSPARPASITRPAYIRKALDLVCAGHITASFFVNREEPLANLLEVMRHLMSHNGHLKTAIIP